MVTYDGINIFGAAVQFQHLAHPTAAANQHVLWRDWNAGALRRRPGSDVPDPGATAWWHDRGPEPGRGEASAATPTDWLGP